MLLEKYSTNQKTGAIIILGVIGILLWSINRLLQNIVISAVVLVLSIFFFIALIWFLINSRNVIFNRREYAVKI
jgi:uncharacterized membrane protein YqjE